MVPEGLEALCEAGPNSPTQRETNGNVGISPRTIEIFVNIIYVIMIHDDYQLV